MRPLAPLCAGLLLAATGGAAQTPEPPPVVRAGLEAYRQQGAAAAFRIWLVGSPIPEGQVGSNKAAFDQIEIGYGHMVGYDVLKVVPVGPHVSRTYIVMLYEKGPVYIYFDCYRGSERWIMTAFFFHARPDSILPRSMLDH